MLSIAQPVRKPALVGYEGSSLLVIIVAIPDRHGGAGLYMARLN